MTTPLVPVISFGLTGAIGLPAAEVVLGLMATKLVTTLFIAATVMWVLLVT